MKVKFVVGLDIVSLMLISSNGLAFRSNLRHIHLEKKQSARKLMAICISSLDYVSAEF